MNALGSWRVQRQAGVRQKSALLSGAVCVTVWTFLSATGPAAKAQKPAAGDPFQVRVLPLLNRYCIDCHSTEDAKGEVAFDQFARHEDAVRDGETWLKVLDALEGNIMPPADVPQPAPEEARQIIDWIENDFVSAQSRQGIHPASVVIRRLNRQEYDNTIRDLVGIEPNLAHDFPADDIAFGFDNIGSALNTSPLHLEKYLDAAEQIMGTAVVLPDAAALSPAELIGLSTYRLPPDDAVEFEHHLSPGRYFVEFSLVRVGIPETVPPPRVVVGLGRDRRTVVADRVQDETVVYRYWLNVAAGDNSAYVALAPRQSDAEETEIPFTAAANVSGDQRYGSDRGLHVDSMVVRGPVPLVRNNLPHSHTSILSCVPGSGDESRLDCGRHIIRQFEERAFRRPVSPDEVEGILRLFRLAHDRGESFERCVQIALTAILASPQFLYLVEPEESNADRPLTEFELASRLSYFLWSTMPDEELFREARHGTLREHLRPQVERMLADRRSAAFAANFAGQWLQLRSLPGAAPDQDLFPSFNDELRQAMREETETLFAWILRENRSALELLDADYTFVNEVLARHYEIEGVSGPEFRRVTLTDGRRGGMLTQASVLTLTSHHTRTSPVKRGQWILQQILGTPPPPPPDVLELDESPQAVESASLRDRLQRHRSSAECAACHNQMDPLGFALENYDAVGRWRTSDGEFPVDASGELSGDRRFQDANELKKLLISTETKRFSRCLVENMLTYALGRALEPADFCTVEGIRKQLAADNYRIRNIVLAIVESSAFQQRGVSK